MSDKNKIALLYEEVKKKISTGKTTPDNLYFDGLNIPWNKGFVTFAFFGDGLTELAYSKLKTHPFIFNALKKAKEEIEYNNYKLSELKKHFKDYEVKIGGNANESDVLYFVSNQSDQDMGETRKNTRSGRVWKSIPSKTLMKNVDIIVFWCKEKDISENELKNIQTTFSLDNILYCGIDSSFFKEYDGKIELETKNEERREFKSKLFPQLSHFDIVKILLKGHINPSELNKLEKKVIEEFRGESEKVFKEYGGYPTKAEFEYRKKLSESVEED